MFNEGNRRLVSEFIEAMGSGDVERYGELLHPDVVAPPIFARPEVSGFAAMKAGLVELHSGLGDVVVQIHALITEDDLVAARYTVTADHTGDFLGRAPTNKRFAMGEAAFYRIADQRIIGVWPVADIFGVLHQISGA